MERNLAFAILVTLFFGAIFVSAYSHNGQRHSPVGYWRTADEKTGAPRAIVQIWKNENNIVMGKVVKVYASNDLCTHCVGENHDKPITGMVIMSGLKAKQKLWTQGKILNTKNGKTYSCILRTIDDGKKLQVRGYTGMPLLGKSQIWERVEVG